MKYRSLGKTGIEVSEIGFGTWGIGGLSEGATSYGKTDDRVSKESLRLAYSKGINFFDTSNVYGDGHSEELLGEVFQKNRKEIILASKFGFLKHDVPQDFSKKSIQNSLEGTLRRLRTDYLDLYQIHSPKIGVLEKTDVIETLLYLKSQGKLRAYGISAKSPSDAKVAIEKYGFDAIQVNFNLTDQRVLETGLFNLCNNYDIGIIGRTPLCFGFLSGSYSKENKFDLNDHRNSWSKEQREIWSSAYTLFSEAIDKSVKQTNAQIALRFCLSYNQISSTIPGMLTPKEVLENVAASEMGPLNKEELLKLENIFKENTFFVSKEIQK
jgi:aryl-alcohol dehydrogenase-like predicted oxidoreductase